MSFVVIAALAVGLLIAVPIAAHLLRRGRAEEQEFPPAALVPSKQTAARQRSRLEDRALLGLRSLIIVALAALGATPLVQCSRLSLARKGGASVAMALVLDDSLSMRGELAGGASRWQQGKEGAEELLRSAREGDAVAIVLAGKPARLALAATTDLSAARAVLDELQPSDRATDLSTAVTMARATLKPLSHTDKRVAVLSDFADPAASGLDGIWAPLPALSDASESCGIASAEVRGRRATVNVSCTSADAARGRKLEIVADEAGAGSVTDADGGARRATSGVQGSAPLAPRAGKQSVTIELASSGARLDARLTGEDALEHDDTAPVAPEASALLVGVVTDPEAGAVSTGGPAILEQALSALGNEAVVRPLSLVPDEAKDLKSLAGLILDDPPGLTPETRSALRAWLERGGVALAFLGPRAATAQLGSTLEPFTRGAVRWEPTEAVRVQVTNASWLGAESESLVDLRNKARARLETPEQAGSQVLARWSDGEAFLVQSSIGRGLALSAGLPSSVRHSDFALRSAFLGLLDHTLEEIRRHTGPRRTPAGMAWQFPEHTRLEIVGPEGPAKSEELSTLTRDGDGQRDVQYVPALRGRYQLEVNGEQQERVVILDPDELHARPNMPPANHLQRQAGGAGGAIDASSELALLLLALIFAELAFRAFTRARRATPAVKDERVTPRAAA